MSKTFTNKEARIIKKLFKKELKIIDFDFDNRIWIQRLNGKVRIMLLPLSGEV